MANYQYIPSFDQVTDILIKPSPQFHLLQHKLSVTQLPLSLKGADKDNTTNDSLVDNVVICLESFAHEDTHV